MSNRLPEWIRAATKAAKLQCAEGVNATIPLRRHRLSTVCEEARCPNRTSCFAKPTATFLILGDICTRDCGFCAVSSGSPALPDRSEPEAVAQAAAEMGLRYVVITSVTRDDLPDGGAGHFAATIGALRSVLPQAKIEVLTPDFRGDAAALATVLDAAPDVFNHNVETVPRLYPVVRPGADFRRSLDMLRKAKSMAPALMTKSGLMVGLGERVDEVEELLQNLRDTGCDAVTMGQYLRPTKNSLPVVEYREPQLFEELRQRALGLGFRSVASGPLVRSSMNAEEMYNK